MKGNPIWIDDLNAMTTLSRNQSESSRYQYHVINISSLCIYCTHKCGVKLDAVEYPIINIGKNFP